jgi:hypothetical protein
MEENMKGKQQRYIYFGGFSARLLLERRTSIEPYFTTSLPFGIMVFIQLALTVPKPVKTLFTHKDPVCGKLNA